MIDKNFAGLNGFVWWVGIVEDRKDPLKLGRCKVRIFGWHTENIADLPTKDLPWAQAMLPLNDANAYSPKESDTVVGFFLDGENAQHPVMMGVLPGIPLTAANPSQGFNDPRTIDQIKFAPVKSGQSPTNYPRTLDEPTTTRLARGDSEFKPEQIEQLEQNIAIFEQQPSYSAKYPYNKVIETEGGHALELDDTPNSERVHLYHTIGSNIEMRPDGTVQQKNMLNHVKNTMKDDINYVKGNVVYYVEGDVTYQIGGKLSFLVGKEVSVLSQDASVTISAATSFGASAGSFASVSGIVSSSLGGTSSLYTSVSGVKTDVSAMTTLSCSGTGLATYGSGGLCTVSGTTINLMNVPVPGSASKSSPAPTTTGADTTTSTVTVDGVELKTPEASMREAQVPSSTQTTKILSDASGTSVISQSAAGTTYLNQDALSLSDKASIATTETYNQVVESVKNLPQKTLQEIGYSDWEKTAGTALEKGTVATEFPNLETIKSAGRAGVDFAAATAKLASNISNLNTLQLATQNFTANLCAIEAVKKETKRIRNKLIEESNKWKNAIQDERDKLREKINNITDEYKNKLKDLDQKALQEWIDTHKYDESCALCAQEAETRLLNGASIDDSKKGLIDCLHREAEAQVNRFKTNLPITDGSIIKSQKEICGTTSTLNIGA